MRPEIDSQNSALHDEHGAVPSTRSALQIEKVRADLPVIHSERDRGLSPGSVAVWFHRLYSGLHMIGCSSHSGRRTFITRAA